jgi:CubicO group peptidase (beta-lactamase class C family)
MVDDEAIPSPMKFFPFVWLCFATPLLCTTMLCSPAGAAEDEITDPLERDLIEFANIELKVLGRTWNDAASFPKIVWEKPDRVQAIIGSCPLQTRWFDADIAEVQTPDGKAPYVAYLEGKSDKGCQVRRLVTVSPGGEALTRYPHPSKPDSFDEKQWALDAQQIAVKRKILGEENKYPALKPPQRTAESVTILRPGTPADAGFKPESIEAMRRACREWLADGKEPFVACVARHGVTVFHEAFGDEQGKPLTVDTPRHMASITKTMSACLFAEFMDQGFVQLDEPVGKILPDFPLEGDKVFTWRATFMHMAGIHIKAGEGREVHNAWSDNWVVNLLPALKIGARHRYNNMDTELTGKAMEMMTGKPVLRLMKEDLFEPLGMDHSRSSDVCHGAEATALDVARLGQMLLNQGAYGNVRFFSKETFRQMLPTRIHDHWPQAQFDLPWGMGLTYFNEKDPDAGKNGVPANKTLLSKMTFCHGAASGAVLRVDPVNEVVVTVVRTQQGENYKPNLYRFLQAVDQGILDRQP